jgi:hypothetical protein
VIAIPTAELVGPGFDFVLGLIRERRQGRLGQDMHDDNLGAAGTRCEDHRLHGRGGRHDGLERDKDPPEPHRDLAIGRHDNDRRVTGGHNEGCNVARRARPTRRRASSQDDGHDVRPSRLLHDPFERPT